MKVGIVSSTKNEWHVQKLLKSFGKKNIDAYVLQPTRFLSRITTKPSFSVKGNDVSKLDAVIVRKVPGGTPEQIFYRMDVLHMLEEAGIFVMNSPDSIERSVDKYYTSALLDSAGIPTPKTIVTENFSEAMTAFEELGNDVVVKPLFGSLGFGMTRLNDDDVAYRVFRALETFGNVFYLQEYISHNNEDIRAFVIHDRVISSMLRKAHGWKTNIAGGGEAHAYSLTDDLCELSVKAAKIIGLDYTGVDILKSEKDGRFYVVEVNSTPGWEGLQSTTDVDVSDAVVNHLINMIK